MKPLQKRWRRWMPRWNDTKGVLEDNVTYCEDGVVLTIECEIGCGAWVEEAGYYGLSQPPQVEPNPSPRNLPGRM